MSDEITKSLIKKMFEKQDELNIHTNGPDWKTNKDLRWYRAIWTELAELIDYTDWKWWKKQDVSLKDIEMELIDIWHFAMSDMMSWTSISIDNCVENTFLAFKDIFQNLAGIDLTNVRDETETLAFSTLRDHRFHLEAFIDLCSTLNMNIDKIYKLYMGKNILNKFRQDMGYKEKKYQKIWMDTLEDNIYLMKFLEETDVTEPDFETIIYGRLKTTYFILFPQNCYNIKE